MKSLEIINGNLEWLEIKGEVITSLDEFALKTIKQDLEVLEIIYNKKVEIEVLELLLVYETNEKIMLAYNSVPSRIKLTLEELLKLKQWLEGNENDR